MHVQPLLPRRISPRLTRPCTSPLDAETVLLQNSKLMTSNEDYAICVKELPWQSPHFGKANYQVLRHQKKKNQKPEQPRLLLQVFQKYIAIASCLLDKIWSKSRKLHEFIYFWKTNGDWVVGVSSCNKIPSCCSLCYECLGGPTPFLRQFHWCRIGIVAIVVDSVTSIIFLCSACHNIMTANSLANWKQYLQDQNPFSTIMSNAWTSFVKLLCILPTFSRRTRGSSEPYREQTKTEEISSGS